MRWNSAPTFAALAASLCAPLGLAACAGEPAQQDTPRPDPSPTMAALGGTEREVAQESELESLRACVLAIAADYEHWGPVDTALRVAPSLCSQAPPVGPASLPGGAGGSRPGDQGAPHARASAASRDEEPPGQRFYSLSARDPAAYRAVASGAPQRDQVIVMAARYTVPYEMPGPGRVPSDVVQTPEGLRRPGAPAGLFVMLHVDAPEQGEAAWRYATVSPQGVVTALGRLEACIACHRSAPHAGLFGLHH